MLFFWSIRPRVIGQQPLEAACTSCAQQTLSAVVLQNIFWFTVVPTFPTKKRVATECSHCRKSKLDHDISDLELNKFEAAGLKKRFRAPLWSYLGLLLLGAFFTYGRFESARMDRSIEQFKSRPAVGDRFVLDEKVVRAANERAGWLFRGDAGNSYYAIGEITEMRTGSKYVVAFDPVAKGSIHQADKVMNQAAPLEIGPRILFRIDDLQSVAIHGVRRKKADPVVAETTPLPAG